MSKEINMFIRKLKNLSQKDIKPYPFEQYTCELAHLQQCAHKADFTNSQLISVWKNIYSKPNFELHHPTYNKTQTRAIQSWQPKSISMRTLVLFIDENHQYPWVLMTTYEQATAMITLENFFINPRYLSNSEHDRWLRWRIVKDCFLMATEKKLDVKNVYFRNNPYCLHITNERPQHYFTDSLF